MGLRPFSKPDLLKRHCDRNGLVFMLGERLFTPFMNQNQSYSDMHWNSASQTYASTSDCPSAQYASNSSMPASPSMGTVYHSDTHSPTSNESYSHSYYPTNNASYNHSSPSSRGYQSYSSFPRQTSDDSTAIYGQNHSHHMQIHRPQSVHPYPTTYPPSSPRSNTPQQYSRPGYTQEKSSPPQLYMAQPASPTQYEDSSSQYPTQIPLSPASTTSPLGLVSPSRPFLCDLCTLSFNRQHDLKRHRETHTGEKPYFCNGGCGKTFTRKDALKRHQLVKNCGKPDE